MHVFNLVIFETLKCLLIRKIKIAANITTLPYGVHTYTELHSTSTHSVCHMHGNNMKNWYVLYPKHHKK